MGRRRNTQHEDNVQDDMEEDDLAPQMKKRQQEEAGDEDETGDETKKFAHLLKPIRDMAENWNIDIATELTSYLEELDALRINIEGGDLGLNFAEAALVVQNSTLVYSKKVEFLYSLVFQTLDLLCDAREEDAVAPADGKKRRKARKSLADVGLEERELFLLLDDVIPIAQNTLLKPDESRGDRSQGLRERVPLALLAGRAGQGDSSAGFNMMNCGIDASGAFILEKGRPSIHDRRAADTNDNDSDVGNMHDADSQGAEEAPFFFADTGDVGGGDGMDFEGNDGADGYQSPSEQETSLGLRQGAMVPPSTDLQRKRTEMRREMGDYEDGDDDFVQGDDYDEYDDDSEATDPWARLDPHEEGRTRDQRPLKPGKTWKVPASLRKDASTGTGISAPLRRAYQDLLFSVAANPRLVTKLPLRPDMVLFPEFRAYATERRRALRELQKSKRSAQAEQDDQDADAQGQRLDDEEEAAAMHLAFESVADNDLESMDGGDADDDDMYQGGGDLDFGGYGSEDENHHGFDARPGLHLDEAVLGSTAPDSYVDMVRAHLQQYMESANQWASESKLHARVRQWEDRIEPFLESQTERPPFDIHAYGERILTRFREASVAIGSSPSTDGNDGEVTFAELSARLGALSTDSPSSSSNRTKKKMKNDPVTTGEEEEEEDANEEEPRIVEQFEVCRAFLASLQLANNGNVELVHETNNSALRVKVLDNVLANKKLETYRAPSIRNDDQDDSIQVDYEDDDEEDDNDEKDEQDDDEEEEVSAASDNVSDREGQNEDDFEAASDDEERPEAEKLKAMGVDDLGPRRAAKKAKIASSPAPRRNQRRNQRI
ncbi:Condensin-2 complex subunit H2 [Hondaea fermentalgiana]|uniref:Condensin-2 complex subunit H2 n=1 Tax=Hondaea fermentalgiana TaxID=2315210 RepID=A0A2R5GJK8_9STRA|nr:Condensin-2 complex subunit H2 [Hondaea fermentalgiana]|eukprot:GBG31076.1 Condensin-2 complex subunit H2 [Hondaea fermentalgiana]